ncbi:hypothetical protein LINPERPRIM_LOCUS19141 [Linum perenne]
MVLSIWLFGLTVVSHQWLDDYLYALAFLFNRVEIALTDLVWVGRHYLIRFSIERDDELLLSKRYLSHEDSCFFLALYDGSPFR